VGRADTIGSEHTTLEILHGKVRGSVLKGTITYSVTGSQMDILLGEVFRNMMWEILKGGRAVFIGEKASEEQSKRKMPSM